MTVLAPAFLHDPALLAVLGALPGARLVGGCVRDAAADRPVADIDLATPDPPDRVVASLRAAGIKVVPTGLKHGTVTAVAGHRPFEVTTLRRDTDTDGRHATVEWTADWREDAARRDFTINAMSMAPDGTVSDYFGGLDDLRAGRVRFVGDPATRIAEDYLRILRYFRFLARYGEGAPDPAAVAAVREGVPGLDRLSPERVWSELKRFLSIETIGPALALMAGLGILQHVLADGSPCRADTAFTASLPADALLRLASLKEPPIAALGARLRMSNQESLLLAGWEEAPALPDDPSDDDLRRALADWPAAVLVGRAWLDGRDGAALERRLATLRPQFPLAGRDVVALGVAPGPAVGATLGAVRAWWLAGGAKADGAACRAELARLVAERRPG